jgi:hypothetical protein
MLHLPVGINTLDKIRSGGFVYVDKTEHTYRIAHKAGAYFLSRPRRFGKSLFLDTLQQLFNGTRSCLKGCTFTINGTGARSTRWSRSTSAKEAWVAGRNWATRSGRFYPSTSSAWELPANSKATPDAFPS